MYPGLHVWRSSAHHHRPRTTTVHPHLLAATMSSQVTTAPSWRRLHATGCSATSLGLRLLLSIKFIIVRRVAHFFVILTILKMPCESRSIICDNRKILSYTIDTLIALCPPSILAKSTTCKPILFGVCLTGFQWLHGLLAWKSAQVTAGAAAKVTVAGAASSRFPRDGADVGAVANTVAGASGGSRIFERGRGKNQDAAGADGYGEAEGLCPPRIFSSKFLVYYGAF